MVQKLTQRKTAKRRNQSESFSRREKIDFFSLD